MILIWGKSMISYSKHRPPDKLPTRKKENVFSTNKPKCMETPTVHCSCCLVMGLQSHSFYSQCDVRCGWDSFRRSIVSFVIEWDVFVFWEGFVIIRVKSSQWDVKREIQMEWDKKDEVNTTHFVWVPILSSFLHLLFLLDISINTIFFE